MEGGTCALAGPSSPTWSLPTARIAPNSHRTRRWCQSTKGTTPRNPNTGAVRKLLGHSAQCICGAMREDYLRDRHHNSVGGIPDKHTQRHLHSRTRAGSEEDIVSVGREAVSLGDEFRHMLAHEFQPCTTRVRDEKVAARQPHSLAARCYTHLGWRSMPPRRLESQRRLPWREI